MYDSLAHLAVLAHESEVRRNAARPEQLMLQALLRTRCRRLLRRTPCPQTA